jgi:hypothetical protein
VVSDPEVARKISELMLECFYRLDASCAMVKQCCPEEEAQAYAEAVERITAPLVLDVLEPLYERYPELKPPHWDEAADEPSM